MESLDEPGDDFSQGVDRIRSALTYVGFRFEKEIQYQGDPGEQWVRRPMELFSFTVTDEYEDNSVGWEAGNWSGNDDVNDVPEIILSQLT